MDYKIDVSVCVALYNSCPSQMLKTLTSIIKQEGVSIEIIIADDGSKIDLSPMIHDFFHRMNFLSYKIIRNIENVGTVKNYFKAAKVSKGRFIKCISPGDLLYSEVSLLKLVRYMETRRLDACFSDAVYYCDNTNIEFPRVMIAPQEINCHLHNSIHLQKLFYLVLNDKVCGATWIVSADTLKVYLSMLVNRVKFSEDSIYRIMIFEERIISYYEEPTVYYHYGDGISTGRNPKWIELLHKDDNSTNMILSQRCKNKSFFEKRYKVFIKYSDANNRRKNNFLKLLLFPESLFLWCKLKINKRFNIKDASHAFYKKCFAIVNDYEKEKK